MANKRYHFELAKDSNELHRKYGKDPEDALFRFQLDLLREQIDPKAFQVKRKDEEVKQNS